MQFSKDLKEDLFIKPQDTELWKNLHSPSYWEYLITGSTVANLIGVMDSYSTPKHCYELMKGITLPVEQSDFGKAILQWGKDHEAEAIQSFKSKFPQYVGISPGLYVSNKYPKYAASLDWIAFDINDSSVTPINVEIKCPQLMKKPKACWLVQIQFQMLATGIKKTYLHIWTSEEQNTYLIHFDQVLADMIVNLLERFFKNYHRGVEPSSRSKKSPINLYLENCISELNPL